MARVAVVGLGEVGRPLADLVAESGHELFAIDVAPTTLPEPATVDVMHVCIPFEIEDFVGETHRYIELLEPQLTVINSTVGVGTTRTVSERSGRPVVHSPIRGKHSRMLEELKTYIKFIGPVDEKDGHAADIHFRSLGVSTRVLSTPEASELAKLTETTYFAMMIVWAQEVERLCDRTGASYDEVVAIYEEIGFFPRVKYFPGVIGGHCVMPNIEILKALEDSPVLRAIRWSNEQKIARDADAS
jgi:UDP-N-acetyl-D-mannosaminuronate dehydrogenase